MVGEWATVSIGEVADKVGMGPFGSSIKVETFVSDGVPIISGQHLNGFKVDDEAGFNFITPEHAERLRSANVRRGDIVLTHRGNIGQVAYVPEHSKFDRYVVSQSQFYMRCDRSKVIPEFVVAYFKTPQGQHKLLANTSQVGVPSIARPVTYMRTIEIPLPPLAEQRAIAHILGALDDKIELNRRMNETLEAIAQAVFKSWFVDFDPVRAKMAGRQPFGMDAATAALFPDSFEDSPLGKIPKGWEVGMLADFAVLNPETWSKDTAPDQIEYVDLSNTKWGRIESTTKYLWEDAPSRAQRVLRTGDTIVGTVRPANGSYALISEEGLTASTGFAVLRPRKPEFREVVYLTATAPDNVDRLAHLADGAAYPAVRPEVVVATNVVKSPHAVIQGFSNTAGPLLGKIATNDHESRTLAALRDALLPKLLSGQVRVKGAEKLVEETA
jgi:type I restriction enzyme, S subunit